MSKSAVHEPPPQINFEPFCYVKFVECFDGPSNPYGKVRRDIRERAEAGKAKYGTYLQPFNGRNAKMDLYQELLDAGIYVQQILAEVDPVRDENSTYWKQIAHEINTLIAGVKLMKPEVPVKQKRR